jgi:hypothetical protein
MKLESYAFVEAMGAADRHYALRLVLDHFGLGHRIGEALQAKQFHTDGHPQPQLVVYFVNSAFITCRGGLFRDSNYAPRGHPDWADFSKCPIKSVRFLFKY